MDIVIVGGGLAGLYTAWKLQTAGFKCMILESKQTLGGRIKTKHHASTDTVYECGASKILPSHINMIRLIKDIGFKSDDLLFTDKIVRLKVGPPPKGTPTIADIVDQLHNDSFDKLNMTLREWLLLRYEQHVVDYIINASGYLHVFEESNALNGVTYLEKDFVQATQIATFLPGLNKIIRRLTWLFKKGGGTILRSTKVYEIKKVENNEYLVNNYKAKKVVIAIPPSGIKNIKGIPQHILHACEGITPVPLIRVFTDSLHAGRVPYTHTSNVVQRTMQRASNFYQCIYASSRNALFWKKAIANKSLLLAFKLHAKGIYNRNASFSDMEPHYWPNGIHLWKPGYDGNTIWRKLVTNSEGVYVVGEAFCPYQRWMESALLTSNDIIEKIKSNKVVEPVQVV